MKLIILKENYPEDKMTEDDQYLILEELGIMYSGTPKGEPEVLQAGERCTRVCVLINNLVNGTLGPLTIFGWN